MDRVAPEVRSLTMRRVAGRNTATELRLRRALWSRGFGGYRLHRSDLVGRPDLAFGRAKLAVFVDGCFWHGCKRCYRRPKSNRAYWDAKVTRNRDRDRRQRRALRNMGWRVLRVWEHELRPEWLNATVDRVAEALRRAV
jgi:DNA mismatch endonuclease (patch repair protein)